ncbi:MAG: META domain-containing protein [Chryseobacterium sp.]|nr:MAG: META domain-containing protein [Chryseobacterium sp.]
MKKFLLTAAFALFAAVLFTSCANKATANSQQLARKWMLVSYKDYSKQTLTDRNAYIDLTKRNGDQYSAYAGCNRMFFTMKSPSAGKINIGQVGSTMMFCADKMDVEGDFGKDLPEMTQYKIEGHKLVLTGNGKRMEFVAEDWD